MWWGGEAEVFECSNEHPSSILGSQICLCDCADSEGHSRAAGLVAGYIREVSFKTGGNGASSADLTGP